MPLIYLQYTNVIRAITFYRNSQNNNISFVLFTYCDAARVWPPPTQLSVETAPIDFFTRSFPPSTRDRVRFPTHIHPHYHTSGTRVDIETLRRFNRPFQFRNSPPRRPESFYKHDIIWQCRPTSVYNTYVIIMIKFLLCMSVIQSLSGLVEIGDL